MALILNIYLQPSRENVHMYYTSGNTILDTLYQMYSEGLWYPNYITIPLLSVILTLLVHAICQ